MQVVALAMRYVRGTRATSATGFATTDDRGEYRIAGLAPDTYMVAALSTERWRTETTETFGYAATFCPAGPVEVAQQVTGARAAAPGSRLRPARDAHRQDHRTRPA